MKLLASKRFHLKGHTKGFCFSINCVFKAYRCMVCKPVDTVRKEESPAN